MPLTLASVPHLRNEKIGNFATSFLRLHEEDMAEEEEDSSTGSTCPYTSSCTDATDTGFTINGGPLTCSEMLERGFCGHPDAEKVRAMCPSTCNQDMPKNGFVDADGKDIPC